MVCNISGCAKRCKPGRKMCSMHCERQRLGRAMEKPAQRQHHGLTPHVRFEQWIVKEHATGCWLWTGSLNNGYGQFNLTGKQMILAHRAAWMLYRGPIPRNPTSAYGTLYVLHHCDTPRCVNPDHLHLGDQQTNADDKMARHRHRYGHRVGSQQGRAKLTEAQVALIRQSPERGAVLATQFGVSRTVIYDIRKGKTWKHVDEPIDQRHATLPVWNKGIPREVWAPRTKKEIS